MEMHGFASRRSRVNVDPTAKRSVPPVCFDEEDRLLHTPFFVPPILRTVPMGTRDEAPGPGVRIVQAKSSVCFNLVADPSPALHYLGSISSARFHQSL